MSLSSQKQVMGGLDTLADASLRGVAGEYRKGVVRPIVAGIKKAKSLEGLMRQLGPGLIRKMDTEKFKQGLADAMTQAALIGAVSATPRGKGSRDQGIKGSSDQGK